MSACGREFHIACMRSKSSSFGAAGRGSRARRRPTKSQTCSISGELAGQGRSCTCRPSVKQHTLMVDDMIATVASTGSNVHLDLDGLLYLGGVRRASYTTLPKLVQSRHGFEGCLASLDLNGETIDPIKDAVVPSTLVSSGCAGPVTKCSTTACANRGICVQMWNSYTCDCDMTSYTGPTCSDDGDRFNSCQVIYSQFGLAIHQNDHQARRRFVEWAQNEIVVVPDFHKRILFSDEAHFWLNGYVNKQNCRIWSEANPQVYVETPLHPEKLTELWFRQDGATCHTARATIDLLKDTFGDRLISRFGPVNWPPRSCDLTPLDYFLWGYVKSLVCADKPQTLDHLEDNILRVIADIRPEMLEKVIDNWTSRLDYIRASRASPMPEIIFKM
ncbi:neurexin-1 [Trichonephila clavipes]|nr:neurexin-1 [Trichonephila clavipes]